MTDTTKDLLKLGNPSYPLGNPETSIDQIQKLFPSIGKGKIDNNYILPNLSGSLNYLQNCTTSGDLDPIISLIRDNSSKLDKLADSVKPFTLDKSEHKNLDYNSYSFTNVDSITLIIAILVAVLTTVVRHYKKIRPVDIRRKIITDFLNRSVLYPLLLLIYSPFDKNVFTYIESSKLAVALAGVVSLVFVGGEIIISCTKEGDNSQSRQ